MNWCFSLWGLLVLSIRDTADCPNGAVSFSPGLLATGELPWVAVALHLGSQPQSGCVALCDQPPKSTNPDPSGVGIATIPVGLPGGWPSIPG